MSAKSLFVVVLLAVSGVAMGFQTGDQQQLVLGSGSVEDLESPSVEDFKSTFRIEGVLSAMDKAMKHDKWRDETSQQCRRDAEQLLTILDKQAPTMLQEYGVDAGAQGTYSITAFSDLYKLSMGGAFQDVDAGRKAEGLQITFSLKVRDSAELKIEDLINAGGGEILMQWSKDIYEIAHVRKFAGSYMEDLDRPSGSPFLHPAVSSVLKPDFSKAYADSSTLSDYGVTIYVKVVFVNGFKMFVDLREEGPEWINKVQGMKKEKGEVKTLVVEASGPWAYVTFTETSMMQATARAIGQQMQKNRGWTDGAVYAYSFLTMCKNVWEGSHLDECEGAACTPVFFFSGRRSPLPLFHLLQHFYIERNMPNFAHGTSSLFAYSAFRKYEILDVREGDSGKYLGEVKSSYLGDPKPFRLVGTHAHEGQMGMQGIASALRLDETTMYPMSAVFWHLNYWLMSKNIGALPDTVGSRSLAFLFKKLKFPESFKASFKTRWSTSQKWSNYTWENSMYDEMKKVRPFAGLVRQDSGTVPCFITAFSATDFKDMASEIGSKEDMNEAHKLKMMADGIGGWLGEKPWKAGQPKDGAILSAAAGGVYGKLDMVAKVSRVELQGRKNIKFSPVKLGDFPYTEWAKSKKDLEEYQRTECKRWYTEAKPSKFAYNPAAEYDFKTPAQAQKAENMAYKRFRLYGYVPQTHAEQIANEFDNSGKFYHEAQADLEKKKGGHYNKTKLDLQKVLDKLWCCGPRGLQFVGCDKPGAKKCVSGRGARRSPGRGSPSRGSPARRGAASGGGGLTEVRAEVEVDSFARVAPRTVVREQDANIPVD